MIITIIITIGKKDLEVSLFQALVLKSFNRSDRLSFQEIIQQTGFAGVDDDDDNDDDENYSDNDDADDVILIYTIIYHHHNHHHHLCRHRD